MNQALLSEPPSSTVRLPWTPGYEALGAPFVHPHRLQPVPEARTLVHSRALARELGLDEQWLRSQEAAEALSGNALLHGSQPVSSVYSGHQFGVWAGQLGDGRAVLLGTLDSPLGPQELQLKGAGLTPYSRMGDGRAVLRSSIREFLVSEAMHALGIPTTRALALVGSPAPVRREVMETAAVVTRAAPSFIRFGHFEHFWANQQIDALRTLSDFVIDRHMPDCRQADGNPHAELLRTVVVRTAELIADWQAVGFCHGVMNTDNMSVLGLTIDYGPFQFLDGYDPGHICNHSDSGGRYAFGQQPAVAHWNLFCLAQAMLPLLDSQEQAIGILEGYGPAFAQAIRRRLKAKLGLRSDQPGDPQLFEAVYALLAHERTDHTIFWWRLGEARAGVADTPDWQAVADLFIDPVPWRDWLARYQARLSLETGEPSAPPMDRTNPSIVLRNHMAETAIQAAQAGDPSEVQRLHQALTRPFDTRPATDAYASFPPDWAHHIEISCSS